MSTSSLAEDRATVVPAIARWTLPLAVLVSAALFAPYLFAREPNVLFFSDNATLYFPHFVDTWHLARRGALFGIDFLTNNGASAHFLRPNLPNFYLPYLVASLVPVESTPGFARLYAIVWFLHSVLAFWGCARVARTQFGLEQAAAVLLAVAYVGAISRYAFNMPIFFYPAALFPWLLVTALDSASAPIRPAASLLRSVPWLMTLTAGYLPVDVNAVMLALGFSAWMTWSRREEAWRDRRVAILRAAAPFMIAGVVAFPIYVAMLRYHALVPAIPKGVWQAAHHLAYAPHDVLGLVSAAFHEIRPVGEWPHVLIGFLPLLLGALAWVGRARLPVGQHQRRMVLAGACIFLFYLLLPFGQLTGLPDLFYFFVPGLGGMHYYGRYLLVASFFLFLVLACVFEPILRSRVELRIGHWAVAVAGLALIVQLVVEFMPSRADPKWQFDVLVAELGMAAVGLFALACAAPSLARAVVPAMLLLPAVANMHYPTNTFSTEVSPPFVHHLSNDSERERLLLDYFERHSRRTLVKYMDLSPQIERLEGIGPNFPWMVRGRKLLSNYIGYELNSSADREYVARFPHWGTVDFEWALRTGAEFVVWREPVERHARELHDWIDSTVPVLDLGFGYRVARLLDAAGNLHGVPARQPGEHDDGLVRVRGADGPVTVTKMRNNWNWRIRFEVESAGPATVWFRMFPNKTMVLKVDGERVALPIRDGLVTLELPAGRHRIEYVYANRMNLLFAGLYAFWGALVVAALAHRIVTRLRSARAGRSVSRPVAGEGYA